MATNTLSPELRARLDTVVHKMVENGEPDSAIQFVVDDFKKKYANTTSGGDNSVLGNDGTGSVAPFAYSGGGEKTTLSERTGLKALGNLPSSFGRFVGSIGSAVLNPIDTAKAVGGSIVGGYQMLGKELGVPLGDKFIPQAEQTGKALSDRYGLTQLAKGDVSGAGRALAKTATEDPFGFGADILAGVEVGALRAGARAGAVTEAATSVVRPATSAVGRGVARVGTGVKDLATGAVGAATGARKAAFEEILTQKPFGAKPIPQKELVNAVREGAAQIAQKTGEEYRAALAVLKSEHPNSLDLSPLFTTRDNLLEQYGVTKNVDGGLDFSRSSLIGDEARVAAVNKLINDWGTKIGDLTAAGIDILKQQIRNFKVNDGGAFDKFAGDLANSAKDVVLKSGDEALVSKYTKLLDDYGTKQDFLAEIRKTLGGNEKLTPDAAITKINGLLADNRDYRRELARDFQQATGKNILGELAKQATSSLTPVSLSKQTALLLSSGGGYALGWNVLPLLALTSPRIMAALFRTLGVTGRSVGSLLKAINQIRVGRGLRPVVLKGLAAASTVREAKTKE